MLEVPQGVVVNLGMELGDPVNTVFGNNGQVSHDAVDWRHAVQASSAP